MAASGNILNTVPVVANFAFCKGVVGRELSYNRANSLAEESRLKVFVFD